jgi:hypothetical protein
MMNSAQPDESDRLRRFLEPSINVIGGVTAVGISILVGDSTGAVTAAAQPIVTGALRKGALDLMHRQLSRREQLRSGAVAVLAAQRVQKMINLGEELRHDGFFDSEPGNRSLAEEIVEGVLIAAQREHEELKLPYLANMLANIAFEAMVHRAEANLLLRMGNAMSYRQLCLIALVHKKDQFPGIWQDRMSDKPTEWVTFEQSFEFIGLLKELGEPFDSDVLHQPVVAIPMEPAISMRIAELGNWGEVLYEAMGLEEIPTKHLAALAEILS